MSKGQKPISFDEATFPATEEPAADVGAWQAKQIKAGLKDADEGRFATTEEMKATLQKFIPIG
jgi:predicted transcriptional regulator